MNTAPRRRWSFSLRTLFVVVTIACCRLGYELNSIRQRHQALRWLEASEASWYAPSVVGASNQTHAPLGIRLFGERGVVGIGMDREEFAGPVLFGPMELDRLFPEARVGFSREGVHEVTPWIVGRRCAPLARLPIAAILESIFPPHLPAARFVVQFDGQVLERPAGLIDQLQQPVIVRKINPLHPLEQPIQIAECRSQRCDQLVGMFGGQFGGFNSFLGGLGLG